MGRHFSMLSASSKNLQRYISINLAENNIFFNYLYVCMLVLSDDHLCIQIRPISGPTFVWPNLDKCWALFGPNCLTL